jgi:hypothetical protein
MKTLISSLALAALTSVGFAANAVPGQVQLTDSYRLSKATLAGHPTPALTAQINNTTLGPLKQYAAHKKQVLTDPTIKSASITVDDKTLGITTLYKLTAKNLSVINKYSKHLSIQVFSKHDVDSQGYCNGTGTGTGIECTAILRENKPVAYFSANGY